MEHNVGCSWRRSCNEWRRSPRPNKGEEILLYQYVYINNINTSEYSFLFLSCITLHFNPTLPSSPDRVVFAIKREQIAANIVNRNPWCAFSALLNCQVLIMIDVLYQERMIVPSQEVCSQTTKSLLAWCIVMLPSEARCGTEIAAAQELIRLFRDADWVYSRDIYCSFLSWLCYMNISFIIVSTTLTKSMRSPKRPRCALISSTIQSETPIGHSWGCTDSLGSSLEAEERREDAREDRRWLAASLMIYAFLERKYNGRMGVTATIGVYQRARFWV